MRSSWKTKGACNSHPERYELWFPTHDTPRERIQQALEICEHECPVFDACRAERRKHRIGIWGGELRGLDTNGPEFDEPLQTGGTA